MNILIQIQLGLRNQKILVKRERGPEDPARDRGPESPQSFPRGSVALLRSYRKVTGGFGSSKSNEEGELVIVMLPEIAGD